MSITFKCKCGKEFTVKDELAGKKGTCKYCGRKGVIPATVATDTPTKILIPVINPKKVAENPDPLRWDVNHAADLRHFAKETNMKLTICPDCGSQVSTAAAACPKCGRPMAATASVQAPVGHRCRHCGGSNIGKTRGLQGVGEVFTFVILFFLGIIPGIIYYIYVESVPYCSGCGKRA
jgi:uncharacterized OB-fold protein